MDGITFHPSSVQPNPVRVYKKNYYGAPRKVYQRSNPCDCPSEGLVSLLSQAYCQHNKIVLRPEDIWMAIQSQFTLYVNTYSEELRNTFVSHSDKVQLKVTDVEAKSQQLNVMSMKMLEHMMEHIKDKSVVDWILPNFSTTTNYDLSIFAMAAMGVMQKYFDYKFQLCCGLPEVTLLGSVEDWTNIRSRVEKLKEYEHNNMMNRWVQLLSPVLDKFIETAAGSPDLIWWNSVCNNHSGGSGPTYLSGWVNVFNVFTDKGKFILDQEEPDYDYGSLKNANKSWPIVNTNDIAKGYVCVNIIINEGGSDFKAVMHAGCLGAKVVLKDTLVPQLAWEVLYD